MDWREFKFLTNIVHNNDTQCIQDFLKSPPWTTIGLLGFFISFLLVGFFVPLNITKELTDIGFSHIGEGLSKKQRLNAINRIRKMRKAGNKVPPPYPNGWFGILESRLLKRGQVQSVDCLGQNFVVFRSHTGEAHILDAYCTHMGAHLGSGGVVKGDCIECPFHQWVFSGKNGDCVNIPYNSSGSIPKVSKIKKWKSCEVNGEIFVWHHAENEEPWEMPSLKEIENGEWVYHGRNEYMVNVHIQDIPENGADVAHLSSVHGPNMLTGNDLRYTRSDWASFGWHSWHASWTPPTDPNANHIAIMKLNHGIQLFNKITLCQLNVTANQIGPGYVQLAMQSTTGPLVCLQTVTPVEPLMQKVVHRFYAPRSNALMTKLTIWGECVMFERDIMVWNHKKFVDSPILIKEDRMIKSYRNWYGQFYSENSISFTMAKENMEW